jgi:hypothetical protein
MKIPKRQLRRIIKEELLREFNPQARSRAQATSRSSTPDVLAQLESAVQEVVDAGKGLFDVSTILSKSPYGIPSKTMTSPLPMVMVDWEGKKYAILNTKYAEDPDVIVGKFAIGAME